MDYLGIDYGSKCIGLAWGSDDLKVVVPLKALRVHSREQVLKAVRAIGLDNTAVDLDMMAVGGEAFVIEVNGRAGASCLPEMVGLRYGTDYYEALIRLALGEDVAGIFARPDMEKLVTQTKAAEEAERNQI